jgi:Inner membrane component of T3SS, cytoplasmic domain/zinc-ribbon domain
MTCRRCGHANEAGANFCSSCGAPLAGVAGPDDTTATLAALEERQELDEELGSALAELPEGVGMLVVRRGPNAGSRYLLETEAIAVGRHPDSDIFLDDITVSRRHAVVRRVPGDGYEVSDVGSLNGTYVNHERVETAPLRYLDELQVGRFVLTFLVGGAAEVPA